MSVRKDVDLGIRGLRIILFFCCGSRGCDEDWTAQGAGGSGIIERPALAEHSPLRGKQGDAGGELSADDRLSSQRDETGRLAVTQSNFLIVAPSFVGAELGQSHRRSMFKKKRTEEVVREERDPRKHVEESDGLSFPSCKTAHSPEDVKGPTKFKTPRGPARLGAFWDSLLRVLQGEAEMRSRETRDW